MLLKVNPIFFSMEFKTIIKQTWLTKKIPEQALISTLLALILLLLGFAFETSWMPASKELVFNKHQYWRLWTTLFVHADMAHLLSNLILFIPFSYFLSGHFGLFFFPFFGFFMGGIINACVLLTMPSTTWLIGVSGVVHFIGAAWMILSFFINKDAKDKRQPLSKLLLKIVGISVILFIPDTYKPQVSYLSHFIGYTLGILCGTILFLIKRHQYHEALVKEFIPDDLDPDLEQSWQKTVSLRD